MTEKEWRAEVLGWLSSAGVKIYGEDYSGSREYNLPAYPGGNIVFAGGGNDTVAGSNGNDLILGDMYVNQSSGGGMYWKDYIQSSDFFYKAYNYTAADWLSTVLKSASGNDSLEGGAGNDRIYGGAGDDYLDGGTGNDYLDGGSGDDWLFGGSGCDTFEGGSGYDVLDYTNSPLSVSVDFARGFVTRSDGVVESIKDIEEVQASNGTFYLSDYVAGKKLVASGSGGQLIQGDIGVDTVSYENSSRPVYADLNTGLVQVNGAEDTLSSIEVVIGSTNSDTIIGHTNLKNILDGHNGNDSLVGGNAHDTIYGGSGNDLIIGSGGSDYIDGGARQGYR